MLPANPVKVKLGLAFLLPALAVLALTLPRLRGRDTRLLVDGLRIAADGQCLTRDPVGGALLLERPAERCALEIESPRALAGLALDVDQRSPAALEVAGAEIGERLFRPDGTIVFELGLPQVAAARGSGGQEAFHYRMALRFESAELGPLTLTLRARRSE